MIYYFLVAATLRAPLNSYSSVSGAIQILKYDTIQHAYVYVCLCAGMCGQLCMAVYQCTYA